MDKLPLDVMDGNSTETVTCRNHKTFFFFRKASKTNHVVIRKKKTNLKNDKMESHFELVDDIQS